LSAKKKSTKRVFYLLGLIAKNRGHRKENRVVEEFNRKDMSNPSWLKRVSKASPEMDKRGIDIIIETTDAGDIFLQIKSSKTGRDKFIRTHPDSNIGVVIIRDEDSDDIIRSKIVSEAGHLRSRYLGKI